ncbi:MAG: hypothetical protein M3276_02475 [Actinomycetota bacterium]|nr:hypothetical protein [Actinomycetota bacterium]
MTARRRSRPALPDPYDAANHPWWDAHDTLDTIAADAATIALAARTAHAQFQAGHDPQLDALAEALGRWWWRRGSLDVVRDALTDPVHRERATP